MTLLFVLHSDFLTVASCLLSVPVVQVLGLVVREQPLSNSCRITLFGGIRHSILTMVSWFLWSVSLIFAAPIVHPSLLTIHPTHVRVFHGAAVALSLVSLFFNIKALFLFQSPAEKLSEKQHKPGQLLKRWMAPDVGFITVLTLGLMLSIMSAHFVSTTDTLPDIPSKCFYSIWRALSAFFSVAASTTHGLGGFLRYGREHDSSRSWKFFQPFVGGRVFIATQALGWSLFSLSLVFFIAVIQQIIKGMALAIRIWSLASGGTAVITQIVLGLSILTFRPGSRERWIPYLIQKCLENIPVLIMYIPVHLICTIWVTSFMLFPTVPVVTFWAISLPLYYCLTSRGNPKQTGCREWPWFQKLIGKYAERSLELWFGKTEVIHACEEKLDPEQSYIYGYHPHGMYPTGAVFMPTLPQFRERVCEHPPVTLGATALFHAPILRDLLCWYGLREVSRSSFSKALKERKSVILCPGGQEEMMEAYRSLSKTDKEIIFGNRHKGFCRMAIEHQASLVPVLSLGEIFTLQNAFNVPRLQKATYKWLGFPIPYLLVGRWFLSPLPKKIPLLYVVGSPIHPPKVKPGDPNYEEELHKLHEQFYDALLVLFDKHKDAHPFYSDAKALVQ